MATVTRYLSKKVDPKGENEIYLRISVKRGKVFRIKSGIFITASRFKGGAIVKPRANQKELVELRDKENALIGLEQFVIGICEISPIETLTKDFILDQIDRRNHPEKYIIDEDVARVPQFFEIWEEFLSARTLSEWRIKHYRVLIRALHRFEGYNRLTAAPDYALTLDTFDTQTLNDFERFLRNEVEVYELFPQLYIEFPADSQRTHKTRRPEPRGNNTIVCTFARLRSFFNWCNEQGLTANKPFAKYSGVKTERYGTPYYITIEERDTIASAPISDPALAIQRDIFVFHCFIGCRVSDLVKLTPANIINGAVEYIASKTKTERPNVIRVPLHARAVELVERYKGADAVGRLFPFLTPQRYNDAIKRVFSIAGITRSVTILNPTTGEEEQRPLNEIASSHLARRTFVGNLYRKVKDPNIIGKLSGHIEGSKAFARYRDIDEDMKRDVINQLGE